MSPTPLVQGKTRPVALVSLMLITRQCFLFYIFFITYLFFFVQTLSKGKAINTEALRKFVSRRKWQVSDISFSVLLFSAAPYMEYL